MDGTSPARVLASLVRAALKAAKAKIRSAGLAKEFAGWPARAAVCERCPRLVVQCGVSYCGRPFAKLPVRDVVIDGCGCPTRAKAKDSAEHCPLTARNGPAGGGDRCDCKWCVALERAERPAAA